MDESTNSFDNLIVLVMNWKNEEASSLGFWCLHLYILY